MKLEPAAIIAAIAGLLQLGVFLGLFVLTEDQIAGACAAILPIVTLTIGLITRSQVVSPDTAEKLAAAEPHILGQPRNPASRFTRSV